MDPSILFRLDRVQRASGIRHPVCDWDARFDHLGVRREVDGETTVDGAGDCEGRQGGDERGVVAELEGWLYCGTEGLFSHCTQGVNQLMERDEKKFQRPSDNSNERGKLPIRDERRMEKGRNGRPDIRFGEEAVNGLSRGVKGEIYMPSTVW